MNKIFIVLCAAGLAGFICLSNLGCCKAGSDYDPLSDPCLMRNAAFRQGKWKFIKIDSFPVTEDLNLYITADSFVIREEHYGRLDTIRAAFPNAA